MKLTPLHLEILLHHFVSPDAFRDETETIQNFRTDLMTIELLKPSDISGRYFITDKGKAWLEHVLATPMPTHKWVWNRQIVINATVGGVMGYAFAIFLETGRPGLGILVFVAWIVGMINSLHDSR